MLHLRQWSEPQRTALGLVPHVPCGRLKLGDHHVGGDHRMRVDCLADEIHASCATHHATRTVGADEILRARRFRPAIGAFECRGDTVRVLCQRRNLDAELDRAAEFLQPCAKNIQRARLRQHPHAGIRHVRRRLAHLDAVKLGGTELLWPVPSHRWRIRTAGAMHRVDHAEIVIDFECARLNALAARAGAMIGRRRVRLDEAEIDAAARQIAGQHQAGETGARDQNIGHEYLRTTARASPWRR